MECDSPNQKLSKTEFHVFQQSSEQMVSLLPYLQTFLSNKMAEMSDLHSVFEKTFLVHFDQPRDAKKSEHTNTFIVVRAPTLYQMLKETAPSVTHLTGDEPHTQHSSTSSRANSLLSTSSTV